MTHPRRHEQEVAEEFDFHLESRDDAARARRERRPCDAEDAQLRGPPSPRERHLLSGGDAAHVGPRVHSTRLSAGRAIRAPHVSRRAAVHQSSRVLTLAIGIGANTAMFSAIDTLLATVRSVSRTRSADSV